MSTASTLVGINIAHRSCLFSLLDGSSPKQGLILHMAGKTMTDLLEDQLLICFMAVPGNSKHIDQNPSV
jgi:hypothetical protein